MYYQNKYPLTVNILGEAFVFAILVAYCNSPCVCRLPPVKWTEVGRE